MSKVVFWAFFEISLLITLEPHVGHTKFPDFYTLSLIIIHSSGSGVSLHALRGCCCSCCSSEVQVFCVEFYVSGGEPMGHGVLAFLFIWIRTHHVYTRFTFGMWLVDLKSWGYRKLRRGSTGFPVYMSVSGFTGVAPLLLLLLLLYRCCTACADAFEIQSKRWLELSLVVFRMARPHITHTHRSTVRSCHKTKTLKSGCC